MAGLRCTTSRPLLPMRPCKSLTRNVYLVLVWRMQIVQNTEPPVASPCAFPTPSSPQSTPQTLQTLHTGGPRLCYLLLSLPLPAATRSTRLRPRFLPPRPVQPHSPPTPVPDHCRPPSPQARPQAKVGTSRTGTGLTQARLPKGFHHP